MSNFNKVILAGNMTRDPELRDAGSSQVCEFGIAINRKWKGQGGQQQEDVCYVDCTAWARTAEVIDQYFEKGKPILIEGRLQLDQWQDRQTGDNRSKLKVVVERFEFLGDGGGQAPAVVKNNRPAAQQEAPANDDEEIPF